MKPLMVLGIVAAVLGAAPAMAADLAVKAPYVAPAFSWTGCYLGIHAGGGIHNSDFTSDPGQGGNIGAVAGGQAGCSYQVRQLVVGLEGEFYWAGLKAKDDFVSPLNDEFHSTASNKYDASIALRLGYAFDRLLVYGKLGADWGRFEWSETDINFPGVGCECTTTDFAAQTVVGLLLGAGFEYAFLDNWTAKLEYNYISFGNTTVTFAETCTALVVGSCTGRGLGFTETERESKQILKVGINYKLNAGAR